MGNVIDLFAGCGGLSTGLELAGFKSIYVNELHPDAMETYLQNSSNKSLKLSGNFSYDITSITKNKKNLDALARKLKNESGEIDLVVGGPPCQGFSGIGHRRTFQIEKTEIPTNHLYKEMAKFISATSPKAFVFENVRGLLNSRWTDDGVKGEIWSDVLNSFQRMTTQANGKKMHYNLYWELVYAKEFGVPQNRPRVILIGVREDISKFNNSDMKSLFNSKKNLSVAPDPIDLLGDLIDPNWEPGGSTIQYKTDPKNQLQEWFRKDKLTGEIMKKGAIITDHDYANHSEHVMEKFAYMIANNGEIPDSMKTKKFAQRLIPKRWGEKGPFITATSLADDYVHFSQPRVLTVREWARLQTFPDSYEFVGKRTTGGRRRAGDPDAGQWQRDLPKYTQIGNAVPVLLAQKIGEIVNEIIK